MGIEKKLPVLIIALPFVITVVFIIASVFFLSRHGALPGETVMDTSLENLILTLNVQLRVAPPL